jgi:uncharacterized glyoxalase superfamily protein PhnB
MDRSAADLILTRGVTNMNRSMPPGVVIPELPYADVREAADWLCRAFGFTERLRIGNHRAQLVLGAGSIVVVQGADLQCACAILVRVNDVDKHFAQARQSGAQIISPPSDYPYGERQYTVEDPGGHRWTFSQSIEDVDPAVWGGMLIE